MKRSPASLELLCAVGVVQYDVPEERIAAGTAVPVVVADVVASVRLWITGGDVGPWFASQEPLVRAAYLGSADGVRFFLGNLQAERWEEDTRAALRCSCRRGRLDMVRLLVEEAGVNPDSNAVCDTVSGGHVHVARWLVEEVGTPLLEEDVQYLVRMSAGDGDIDYMRWLVVERGVDVHGEDNAALRCSARCGRIAALHWLLSPESGGEWTAAVLNDIAKMRNMRRAARQVLVEAAYRLDPSHWRAKRRK